jgi:hypothetical protein
MALTDYTLKSRPRITYPVFAQVLKSAGSPVYSAGESKACWNAITKYGIDPALALAQFDKESSYGKYGVARPNKSWGNLRGTSGLFKKYATWANGAADYAHLLAGPLYAGNSHYNTARTMPFRYAPSADHNSPLAYGQFLVTMIQHYIALNPPTSPPQTKVFHTVRSGETLSGIAAAYHTTVARILAFPENAKYRANPSLIHPGDVVRVR